MSEDERNSRADTTSDAAYGEEESRHERQGRESLVTVPPFQLSRFEGELTRDALLRWGMIVGMVAVFMVVVLLGAGAGMAAVVALALVMGVWLVLNATSARVSRELPELAAMIEADPATAEDRIAANLRAKPLMVWVRLMLYHRLAALRHRQRRFGESLAIAAAVLGRDRQLGPARDTRAHLLLILAEAAMEQRDLASAYHALGQLHYSRLSLVEALQRLALQMRYEVMCGYHQRALDRSGQKVQLAELMPAAQCGAVHAILATAATRMRQQKLAHWLWQRAELLCTADQLAELKSGGFSVGMVEVARPQEAAH